MSRPTPPELAKMVELLSPENLPDWLKETGVTIRDAYKQTFNIPAHLAYSAIGFAMVGRILDRTGYILMYRSPEFEATDFLALASAIEALEKP